MIKFISEPTILMAALLFAALKSFQNVCRRVGLAQVLRQVRQDLSVVVLRAGPECYMITNTTGNRVFEARSEGAVMTLSHFTSPPTR